MFEDIGELSEWERKKLQKKFYSETPEPFTGLRITLFFPYNSGLKPIDLIGVPPVKGQVFYFRNYAAFSSQIIEGRNFEYPNHSCWKVKEVSYSVAVPSTIKEELLFDGDYRVEVQLVKYHPLFEIKHFILKWTGYYPLMRFINSVKYNKEQNKKKNEFYGSPWTKEDVQTLIDAMEKYKDI